MVDQYASDIADLEPEERVSRNDEIELPFLQLISVYVGAIRCGVLGVDHAVAPLARFGRLGVTYDAVVRRLVDVMKDEGLYNRDAETVIAVSCDALKAVS
jgi:cohesin complex subunit SA-1/2